jgi:hypothetical protein
MGQIDLVVVGLPQPAFSPKSIRRGKSGGAALSWQVGKRDKWGRERGGGVISEGTESKCIVHLRPSRGVIVYQVQVVTAKVTCTNLGTTATVR